MNDPHWPIIIATWGEAKLLRFVDDHYEIQGGTSPDQAQALKWIQNYMPEVADELKESQRGDSESAA